MSRTKEQILADIKALNDPTIKREVDTLFSSTNDALADAINLLSLRMSNPVPFKQFEKGDNFSKYCKRFLDHVETNQTPAETTYLTFTQNILCEDMYSTIKSIDISDQEKLRPKTFVKIFQDHIYGENSLVLRNELHSCIQKKSETISEYAYRLRDKSSIAYPDNPNQANSDCLIVFLRGIGNAEIKRKVNESNTITDFSSAVKYAKNLENVEKC